MANLMSSPDKVDRKKKDHLKVFEKKMTQKFKMNSVKLSKPHLRQSVGSLKKSALF